MLVGLADFPTGDGNHTTVRIGSSLPVFQLKEVECRHGGIEVEMQRLLRACLTVGQAGKLFGITEQGTGSI